ncbi:zinc ribbon domain-containing protein [Candidatus Fermentibacteria bacterium]|nr:zinc ribbon domain-containing protein [Candidatus Fermentibacteria bacterium]
MPTYEYECEGCGSRFERFQQMTEAPLTKCPSCGGSVRRIIGTGSGIIFKGAGFYATDYRKGACPEGKGSCEAARPSDDSGGHTCSGGCCRDK